MKDPDNINVVIGRSIRFFREQKGWTLEELAERSGYDVNSKKSSMSKIENGKNDIPTSRLYAIAKALEVDITDLIREDRLMAAKEKQICELFSDCYGTEVFQTVQLLLRLDAYDRGQIRGRIETMLESEKYAEKKEKAFAG